MYSGACCSDCADASSGLGFPIVPIIMGAVSAVGALRGRGKSRVTDEQAREAVKQVYLELLEREPDPGAQGYVDCLYKGAQHDPDRGWCDVDFIRTELLRSQEYRDLQLRKAAIAYNPAASAAVPGMPGAMPVGGVVAGGMDLLSGGIAGIPFTWIALGLGLVLLMKKR